jgi:transposase
MITRIYIGVDISKNWFDVCTSLDEKAPVERYLNNPDGHARFITAVSVLARKVHVCMEYTGGYETPLALACRGANLIVSLIDGGKFSTFRKSFGRARAKTDRQDARLLARFGSERKPPEWFPVPDEYRTLRELVRHRQRLLEAKTEWGSRASHSVQSELVSAQRLAQRQVLGLQVKECDKAIDAHLKAHPSLEQALGLLVSIPGIAKVAAARILAESGPISNYKSARQYAMAAGLSPIVLHSGQKTPPGKLPVYGNAELRCALFLPVVASMSHKTGVWDFMQRIQKNGDKLKMTVIAAGMRKLAHIIYGVLKSKENFDKTKL